MMTMMSYSWSSVRVRRGVPSCWLSIKRTSRPCASNRSRTMTRIRIPSHPSKSDFVFKTYRSIPPYCIYAPFLSAICLNINRDNTRTLLIVRNAFVVNLTLINSCKTSEKSRLEWTFGSQVRRVLCFEKGTLFPYCFILPWKRPSWERLNGALTISNRGKEGNMAVCAWAYGSARWWTPAKKQVCLCKRVLLWCILQGTHAR